MEKPKLRPIQAVPVSDRGRTLIQIFDPTRISDKVLIVPRETLLLLSLFDGTRTLRDIQTELVRHTGQFVLSDDIQSVVDRLDGALMLESDRFRAHVRQLQEAYRRAPVRRPASAGTAYPAEPSALRQHLDELFAAEGLPLASAAPSAEGRLVGLVAPHIDLERGGPSYAHAYAALAASSAEADLFVVFGTAHHARDALFILTAKDFRTPLGTLPTDAELVHAVAERAGCDLFREELVHASEHSIEFQILFLQHLLRGRPARVLPVLCGFFEARVKDGQRPEDVPAIAAVLDALRSILRDAGRRVCAIAGADLAHVGAHFGDSFTLTSQVMADVERADRQTLAHVESLDPHAFFHAVCADDNARHICGLSPIYALLATTQATRGRLLDYRQAVDYDLQRAVTFAALALYA